MRRSRHQGKRRDDGNGYTKADPRRYRQNAKGGSVPRRFVALQGRARHFVGFLDAEGWALLRKFVADGVVANMLKDYNAGTCPKSHNAC